MNSHADKLPENKNESVSNAIDSKQPSSDATHSFQDNRSETIVQQKLQKKANDSPRLRQLKSFQTMADNSSGTQQVAQLKQLVDYSVAQPQPLLQKKNDDVGEAGKMEKPSQEQQTAQLATTSDLAGGHYAAVDTFAKLNTLLGKHAKAVLTIDRIYSKKVTLGGAAGNMLNLGGWNVDESIQDRFATRAVAEYADALDTAMAALNLHFWETALPVAGGVESLHMINQNSPYNEANLIGAIRGQLRATIGAMAVVAAYTEGAFSVDLAALAQLRAQVPVITLEAIFGALNNPIAGAAWDGTKIIHGHRRFAYELKMNHSGATRIMSVHATPHLFDIYRLNGLH